MGLLITAFALGLRHGLDWDHIAAVSDLAAPQTSRSRAGALGMLYFAGHSAAVLALGLVAVVAGAHLPVGVEVFMERAVGLTLVALGLYVVVDLVRQGKAARPRSRWTLALDIFRRLRRGPTAPVAIVIEHDHAHSSEEAHEHDHDHAVVHHLPAGAGVGAIGAPANGGQIHRHHHHHVLEVPDDPFPTITGRGALAVGVLHGIGVETPTQVLVLVGAVGAGAATGAALLVFFVAGLLCTNALLVLGVVFGLTGASGADRVRYLLAVAVAALSLVVGLLLLLGRGGGLPALLG